MEFGNHRQYPRLQRVALMICMRIFQKGTNMKVEIIVNALDLHPSSVIFLMSFIVVGDFFFPKAAMNRQLRNEMIGSSTDMLISVIPNEYMSARSS